MQLCLVKSEHARHKSMTGILSMFSVGNMQRITMMFFKHRPIGVMPM